MSRQKGLLEMVFVGVLRWITLKNDLVNLLLVEDEEWDFVESIIVFKMGEFV